MKAVVEVTKIDWDTDTDDGDTTGVDALPKAPFTVTVDAENSDTLLEPLLDHLSDTHGFLILDVEYRIIGFTADVDESSHYSSY